MSERPTLRAPHGRWTCNRCGEVFDTRAQLFAHGKSVHNRDGKAWNAGLTAATCPAVARGAETLKRHYADGSVKVWCEGKHLDDSIKMKISASMKLAHANGIAHNIGESRHNNQPSYPEEFFIRAIEKNIDDKNYCREYTFDRFSLDFAWPHLKKCIEIDGAQHKRFYDVRSRDAKKNILLMQNGWSVMRIPWIEMFNNPQLWIQKAKQFIDGYSFLSLFT